MFETTPREAAILDPGTETALLNVAHPDDHPCPTCGAGSTGAAPRESMHDVVQERLDCLFAGMPDDPRKALDKLIAAEVAIALDPAVSLQAQALIDRGRVSAERCSSSTSSPPSSATIGNSARAADDAAPVACPTEIRDVVSRLCPDLEVDRLMEVIGGPGEVSAYVLAVIRSLRDEVHQDRKPDCQRDEDIEWLKDYCRRPLDPDGEHLVRLRRVLSSNQR